MNFHFCQLEINDGTLAKLLVISRKFDNVLWKAKQSSNVVCGLGIFVERYCCRWGWWKAGTNESIIALIKLFKWTMCMAICSRRSTRASTSSTAAKSIFSRNNTAQSLVFFRQFTVFVVHNFEFLRFWIFECWILLSDLSYMP